MENTKLSNRQKIALFKREYGERLIPEGFRYIEKCFYRCTPGQVLLTVNLELPRGGWSERVGFQIFPFCIGITSDMQFITIAVKEFIGHVSLSPAEPPPRNSKERQYRIFFEEIFPRLNGIQDVRSVYAFQEWYTLTLGRFVKGSKWKMLECLQMRQYDQAKICAAQIIERANTLLQQYRATRERDLKFARSKKAVEQIEESFHSTSKNLQESIDEIHQWMQWVDTNQVDRIEQEIQKNIAISDATCRALYPEFYK